jgi:hypothetical protein
LLHEFPVIQLCHAFGFLIESASASAGEIFKPERQFFQYQVPREGTSHEVIKAALCSREILGLSLSCNPPIKGIVKDSSLASELFKYRIGDHLSHCLGQPLALQVSQRI